MDFGEMKMAEKKIEQQTQKSKKENAKHFRLSKPGLISNFDYL